MAGFHTEYSGFRWALYFLAEYANIFVVSRGGGDAVLGRLAAALPERRLAGVPLNYGFPVLLFVGSAILSIPLVKRLRDPLQQNVLAGAVALLLVIGAVFAIPAVNAAVIGLFWFLFKVSLIIYLMIWFRGTFPRFRYDQLMNIGWKVMIPIGMAAVLVNALLGML